MTLEARNAIAPQMADYDRVGDQWVPYLMRFDRPLREYPAVHTDEWGKRRSTGAASAPDYHGVVIGSSAVFGVGATTDSKTVPSVLNTLTKGNWLNFGGRAFNSTQELILFLLHWPAAVDRIVVMSGVNNLTLAFLSDSPSRVYNSFFFQSLFQRAMAAPAGEFIGVRRALSRLILEVRHRFAPVAAPVARDRLEGSYEEVMACFTRDLKVMHALARGRGATLHFALQPLATWIDKKLSAEEQKLFGILDAMSRDWEVLSRHMGSTRDRYFADVEETCRECGVPFVNLNLDPAFATGEWLFVDRVHLTDRGYELAANIMQREFAL